MGNSTGTITTRMTHHSHFTLTLNFLPISIIPTQQFSYKALKTSRESQKLVENALKEQTTAEKTRVRLQQEANKQRKLENEQKSTITQSVSSSKVKRMAKKQLRALIKV